MPGIICSMEKKKELRPSISLCEALAPSFFLKSDRDSMPGMICSMESYPQHLPAHPDRLPDSIDRLPAHPDRLPDSLPDRPIDAPDDHLTDQLDRLPDPIVLVILNRVADVKSLGRCAALSRRFRSLVPLVHRVHLPVDCVLPDDPSPSAAAADDRDRPRAAAFFSHLMHALSHLLLTSSSRRILSSLHPSSADSQVSHHSPDEVLRSFKELRHLEIVLPDGELGLDDGVLLRWRAGFSSTLETCVILGASSVFTKPQNPNPNPSSCNKSVEDDMISNAILKHRVIWTISALIAASSRHYLLEKIVSGHETLEQLELSDKDGQGVLTMDKKQLQGFRANPIPASCGALRTVVPALSVKLWYAPALDLPCGVRLEGATLVAIRPSGSEDPSGDWVLDAFDEPYQSAVRMLVTRRNYRIEMNSF